MPFVDVAKSVGGGAVVEVAVRRMSWSMSSQGAPTRLARPGVEEVTVEPRAQEGAELVMGVVVTR